MHSVEYVVNVDPEEPSWWVWVTEEMVPSNTEEWSGIDNENYVIIGEEHVVEGVANFIAKCILSSPKSKVLILPRLFHVISVIVSSVKNQLLILILQDMKPEDLQRSKFLGISCS